MRRKHQLRKWSSRGSRSKEIFTIIYLQCKCWLFSFIFIYRLKNYVNKEKASNSWCKTCKKQSKPEAAVWRNNTNTSHRCCCDLRLYGISEPSRTQRVEQQPSRSVLTEVKNAQRLSNLTHRIYIDEQVSPFSEIPQARKAYRTRTHNNLRKDA